MQPSVSIGSTFEVIVDRTNLKNFATPLQSYYVQLGMQGQIGLNAASLETCPCRHITLLRRRTKPRISTLAWDDAVYFGRAIYVWP